MNNQERDGQCTMCWHPCCDYVLQGVAHLAHINCRFEECYSIERFSAEDIKLLMDVFYDETDIPAVHVAEMRRVI